MKALCKTLVLMLASVVLASCGGGGGGSNSAFGPPAYVVSIQTSSSTITTNSFTAVTVTVKTNDGGAVPDGTTVNLAVSPSTIGTVAGQTGSSGATATNTTNGGIAAFTFSSSNQAGTAHLVASAAAGLNTSSAAADVTVNSGNIQDPRLQLSATTTTLPVSPYTIGEEQTSPFPGNYPGSPYISEVTVTWRHTNGQLVSGTLCVNVSVAPVTTIQFSQLISEGGSGSGGSSGCTIGNPTTGDLFHNLEGSGPVQVTGGVGTIFVHAGQAPGVGTLSVTGIDPDSGQTISSQLQITVAGGATGTPQSISISWPGTGVYISGSNGPQSTVLSAIVTDGSGGFVNSPAGVDNVQFSIVGPANSDASLATTNAAGAQVSGTTVSAPSFNGTANVTFRAGTQQGPVQVKVTADRSDNNVDNGVSDPVSATTTVVVSDGKLDSLTIDSPDAAAINSTGVSGAVVEDPPGSGNYEIAITAKGVDRQGNSVVPGTQIAFGDIDAPQTPTGTTGPQGWFLISGSHGNPQEGGKLFTATDGKFTSAGGGAGPGDTLLVIGKLAEGAPAGNDDLESSDKITGINSATSLNVAAPFNLNDQTGVSVDYGSVLPYLIGRATFTSVQSPSYTDTQTDSISGEAITTLSYPASQIGKAVAVWAQGTGTDVNTSPGRTDVITDIIVFTLPGMAEGAYMTASPDPIYGNQQVLETVCYYDGNNRPIPNFDINFAFDFTATGVGSGSADGVSNAGKFQHLTGSNGCVTVSIVTASVPTTSGSNQTPTVTFSAGPTNAGGSNGGAVTFVKVPIVVNAAQLQASCPNTSASGVFTVTLTLLNSSGTGLPGETITATCAVTSATGSITPGTILPTNANGTTTVPLTVNPAGTTGQCIFQDSNFPNLVATTTISASGGCQSSGGFSPPP